MTGVEQSHMDSPTSIRSLDDLRRLRPEIMELARECRAREVSVFGSLVRGEMRDGSDIDFLVDFEDGYSLLDIGQLLYELQDLLGCRVDVIDRPSLRHELHESVFREAQKL